MMKAIILAAGMGLRIRSKFVDPKALIKIGKETILDRQLRLLKEVGIKDVYIVTGYKEYLIKQQYPQLNFITNPFYMVTNTLASLMLALVHVKEDTFIINGDTVFSDDLLPKMIGADNYCGVQNIDRTSEEVTVTIENNKITNIGKWVMNDIEAVGVYKLNKSFLLDLYRVSENTKTIFIDYYEDGFNRILRSHLFYPVFTFAEEIDTYDDYKRAQERFG
ncbi:MAG: hypothetical protein PWQ82_1296 [Thermosediminibacterales bacterium]|nr:hypothetical protein [Thermosediminibacterales bacterium]MDK2836516.1 hypothetical protein [Thermosediminibacterales bacterium]